MLFGAAVKESLRKPSRNATSPKGGLGQRRLYQVRFLWRFACERLRRLCLFIFKRRFFLRLPIGEKSIVEGLFWRNDHASASFAVP